jgi:hypothetical protein
MICGRFCVENTASLLVKAHFWPPPCPPALVLAAVAGPILHEALFLLWGVSAVHLGIFYCNCCLWALVSADQAPSGALTRALLISLLVTLTACLGHVTPYGSTGGYRPAR